MHALQRCQIHEFLISLKKNQYLMVRQDNSIAKSQITTLISNSQLSKKKSQLQQNYSYQMPVVSERFPSCTYIFQRQKVCCLMCQPERFSAFVGYKRIQSRLLCQKALGCLMNHAGSIHLLSKVDSPQTNVSTMQLQVLQVLFDLSCQSNHMALPKNKDRPYLINLSLKYKLSNL